ncbi:hypothetical protein ACFL0W_06350 [Nanoarchaeota archaeon]
MDKLANKKLLLSLLVVLLVIPLLASSTLALGIGPARTSIQFESNLEYEYSIEILNNQNKDMKAVIYTIGELAEYIVPEERVLLIENTDASRKVNIKVNLPEKLAKPGTHTGEVVVIPLPATQSDETILIKESGEIVLLTQNKEAKLTSMPAVTSQVHVLVPYPGKYVEAKFRISAKSEEDSAEFTIPVYNFGTESIGNVSATIEILGPTNERIGKIKTTSISLQSKSEGKLFALYKERLNSGSYHAIARLNYDGVPLRLDANFNVGSEKIDIKTVALNPDFTLGSIAQLDILLENRWNKAVTNVFANVRVLNSNGAELTNFKTASIDIEPYTEGTILAYWDTQNINPGTYDVDVSVQYEGKLTQKLFELAVGFGSAAVKTAFPTAQAVSTKDKFISLNNVLVLVVILLISLNVYWIFYIRHKQKPPNTY